MKSHKFLCFKLLFTFLALTVHKTQGAIHLIKISGVRFENVMVSNGSRRVRTVSFHSPPGITLTKRVSRSFEMEDAESLLLVLELDNDFDDYINDIA